jgi:hypothetical protein
MDDLDAFIDSVDAVDDTGEVTVSGVDSGNRNNVRAVRNSQHSKRSYRNRTSARNRAGGAELSREMYWERRNQPKYEKTDWAATTVQLPIGAPYSETKQIKHHIHRQTVERIRRARSSWQDKDDLLLSRFYKLNLAAFLFIQTSVRIFLCSELARHFIF